MQRPKRQAAQDAIAKIRDIREWETLPESSQRFQECAALIDAELESEIKKKKVERTIRIRESTSASLWPN